jgi:drug/metabolite transporter (DMT)-like permease
MADTATAPLSARASRQRGRLIGIALMCLALLCFSGLDATAKWVNRSVDPLVTVWARYVSAAGLTFIFINPWTKPGAVATRRLPLQLARSFLLFLSTICNFVALQYLQLVEALSIVFSTPLIVALLAGPILGERIGMQRLIAVCVGFIGVLVVARPGLGTMHPAALLSLTGAVAYAFYGITTRMLASTDSSATTIIYSSLAASSS